MPLIATVDRIKIGKIPKICLICQTQYFVWPCRSERTKCCSKACLAKTWIRTDETRHKIGDATRGKREATTGSKNYNWNGGGWAFWKRVARERDMDICQCIETCSFHIGRCGFSDSAIMHVDHIKPKKLFPELTLKLDNLITLCPNCHQCKTNRERREKIFKVGRKKYD